MRRPGKCNKLVVTFLLLASQFLVTVAGFAASHVSINADHVLTIDGRKIFPIGFTMPPPPDGKAANGKNGIEELPDAGATFLRTGVMGETDELGFHITKDKVPPIGTRRFFIAWVSITRSSPAVFRRDFRLTDVEGEVVERIGLNFPLRS